MAIPQRAVAQQMIDPKVRESLLKTFGDSITVTRTIIRLSEDERKRISDSAKSNFRSDTLLLYECRIGQKLAGYGFVDDVKGKMQLITYLVSLTPDGTVQDVDVLAYRESYGGEIAYESFRKQFQQKTAHDRLRVGKDIKNISGATISAHALTDGVRKLVIAFALLRARL